MTTTARAFSPAPEGVTDTRLRAGVSLREGDIIVCTPPKSGTTWTQTILAILVHGTTDLPAPVPVLSPLDRRQAEHTTRRGRGGM